MTIRFTRFLLFIVPILTLVYSCSKINESTDLGDEIIPGVDGVTTIDTTLEVEAYNYIFNPVDDSVRVLFTDDHILGNISLDPFFGKTNAKIFVELKPPTYKWNFRGVYNKDSLFLDSVVMVLGWTSTWGDTTAPQQVKVYEMDPSSDFRTDSFYVLRTQYFTYSNLLGSKLFLPSELNDSVKAFQDTTINQLRVRLNDAFGQRLLEYDSTNAYASDSAFKTYFKGFAIESDNNFGNALMSFGLYNNPNTKLAIYYHYKKDGKMDTVVDYFPVTALSATHNYIERYDFTNPAGLPIKLVSDDNVKDDLVYLINTPGSYATIKIPAIKSLGNMIINRAELIVEQVYDPTDRNLTPPEAVLLDVYDTALKAYKFLPYDFIPDQTGADQLQADLYGKNTLDAFGNPIRVWKINMTRYVQNVLTGNVPLYDLRLVTRKSVVENVAAGFFYTVSINSQFAFGRVRLGGGNHPTQPMRLRIIYTKI